MKVFPASAIHNVAIVGHNGVGKTTLVSALLHEAGAVPRFGRVEDGSAPTDFDPEEVAGGAFDKFLNKLAIQAVVDAGPPRSMFKDLSNSPPALRCGSGA